MEKGFKKIACEVLGITPRSYSNYSEQKRPIILLLELYTNKKDLEELLATGRITKFENLPDDDEILEKIEKKILNRGKSLKISNDIIFNILQGYKSVSNVNNTQVSILDFSEFLHKSTLHQDLIKEHNIDIHTFIYLISVCDPGEFEFLIKRNFTF